MAITTPDNPVRLEEELLQLQEADAWFVYRDATQGVAKPLYGQIEPAAWHLLSRQVVHVRVRQFLLHGLSPEESSWAPETTFTDRVEALVVHTCRDLKSVSIRQIATEVFRAMSKSDKSYQILRLFQCELGSVGLYQIRDILVERIACRLDKDPNAIG